MQQSNEEVLVAEVRAQWIASGVRYCERCGAPMLGPVYGVAFLFLNMSTRETRPDTSHIVCEDCGGLIFLPACIAFYRSAEKQAREKRTTIIVAVVAGVVLIGLVVAAILVAAL